MKRTLLCATVLLGIAIPLCADSNLRIEEVGFHGYVGVPSPVTIALRNPSEQPQQVHLQITVESADPAQYAFRSTVTEDVALRGGEQRRLEVPVLLVNHQKLRIAADATAGGSVFGHDKYEGSLAQDKLIVLLCAKEEICKNAQSQMQFSGSPEARDEKNRDLVFQVISDPRDDWWAYSAANTVVVAVPIAQLTTSQRDALEGYLRCGGRLILLEDEIADPAFLSAYRKSSPLSKGEHVGKGTLFLASGLKANMLGDVFSGQNLRDILQQYHGLWQMENPDPLSRFATAFSFPRLRWLLIWLAVYILVIGIVNFAVLRRLKRLDLGWISVCVLALLFAAGFYLSSSSKRPKQFRLDNLDSYYLDSRSALAAADYRLRVSAPQRRDVMVSVADPAIFAFSNYRRTQANSQIWVDMIGQGAPTGMEHEIRLGPPRETELSLLKWSFRDLKLRGLRPFPGTVHFVAPNRLRNDTGQLFTEGVFVDNIAHVLYTLPPFSPGEEFVLDSHTAKAIPSEENRTRARGDNRSQNRQSLTDLVTLGAVNWQKEGRFFAGISDGPSLPADLNLSHQQNVHTLIVVSMEQP